MEDLKATFLRIYANVPLSLRDDPVLVIKDEQGLEQPISWNVAYIEIKHDSTKSAEILKGLRELEII